MQGAKEHAGENDRTRRIERPSEATLNNAAKQILFDRSNYHDRKERHPERHDRILGNDLLKYCPRCESKPREDATRTGSKYKCGDSSTEAITKVTTLRAFDGNRDGIAANVQIAYSEEPDLAPD